MAATNTRNGNATTGTPRRMRRLGATALLLFVLTLPSCFTLGLWGFEREDEVDPFTGEQDSVMAYDPETEWSWKLFVLVSWTTRRR